MATLKLIYGDATNPEGDGKKYIIHIANNVGAWGAGFVLALSKKWPATKEAFKDRYKYKVDHKLGDVQFIYVDNGISVVNMIAQNGINDSESGWQGDLVEYDALSSCLDSVFDLAAYNNATVHAPKIGSGLAGGDWSRIEEMLLKCVDRYNVDCTIYLLKGNV